MKINKLKSNYQNLQKMKNNVIKYFIIIRKKITIRINVIIIIT